MRLFSRATSKRAGVALACSAALLAAGCSNASPGVVAYVGDEQITQEELESAVAGVSATAQEGQTVSNEAVINVLIQGELAAQVARDRTISITDSQRDKLLRTTNLAPLLDEPSAKQIAYDVADQSIVAQELGEQAFLSELQKRTVTLNPRYGVLDPQQKVIRTDESSSLSQPAPAPAP